MNAVTESGLQQHVIDEVIDHCRGRLHTCVRELIGDTSGDCSDTQIGFHLITIINFA